MFAKSLHRIKCLQACPSLLLGLLHVITWFTLKKIRKLPFFFCAHPVILLDRNSLPIPATFENQTCDWKCRVLAASGSCSRSIAYSYSTLVEFVCFLHALPGVVSFEFCILQQEMCIYTHRYMYRSLREASSLLLAKCLSFYRRVTWAGSIDSISICFERHLFMTWYPHVRMPDCVPPACTRMSNLFAPCFTLPKLTCSAVPMVASSQRGDLTLEGF